MQTFTSTQWWVLISYSMQKNLIHIIYFILLCTLQNTSVIHISIKDDMPFEMIHTLEEQWYLYLYFLNFVHCPFMHEYFYF